MRVRRAIALVAALAVALGPAPAGAQDDPPRTFAFLSHAGGVERQRLAEFGSCVDVVAPNWYTLTLPGGTIGARAPDAEVTGLAAGAGAALWPVVNAQLGGGGNSLANSATRARIARRVAAIAGRHSYDGMTLDVEGIAPSLRGAFSSLVRRVDARLAADSRRLAVYAPRRTAEAPTDWAAAYDWPALARAADLLIASGYNEHYAGGEPGPITTTAGWLGVLDYGARASLRKVAPTLGAFGYHWPSAGGTATLVSAADVEANARASAFGVTSDGEVTYPTLDGVVWSETAAGLVARANQAAAAGFRWLGLFSLGREPESFWSTCR
jgi:spore germination protein YaaH